MGRRGGLVLVVDDDPIVRGVVREALGEEGYRVAAAATFAEAVTALTHTRFDLVLTDALLADAAAPMGNWWETVERIKAMAGYAPVAIFTAADPTTFADYAARGFVELLPKPFDLDELVALVRRHLGPPPRERP
jgi:two-component system, NtrC family, nitrogen regulation response regulator GlnG